MTLRDGLLMLRSLDADGGPVVPATWTVQPEDGGWYTVRRDSDGITLAAHRENTDTAGTLGLFVVMGPRAVLDAIAAASSYAATLQAVWDARATSATALAVLRRLRTWRFDGFERDEAGNPVAITGGVRTVIFEGQALPDPNVTPLPWLIRADGTITTLAAQAQYRIDAIIRPALACTMAGYHDDIDAEATT